MQQVAVWCFDNLHHQSEPSSRNQLSRSQLVKITLKFLVIRSISPTKMTVQIILRKKKVPFSYLSHPLDRINLDCLWLKESLQSDDPNHTLLGLKNVLFYPNWRTLWWLGPFYQCNFYMQGYGKWTILNRWHRVHDLQCNWLHRNSQYTKCTGYFTRI